MNTSVKIIVGVVVVVLIAWGAYALFNKPQEVSGESIKIGALLPLSGFAANYGDESRRGFTIAQEDLARRYPGLTFEIFYEDSFYNPKGAVDAYQKLRNVNNVSIVIAGASHVAIPIKPLAVKDNVLEIAIWSGAPSYSDDHNLNFRTTLIATDYAPILVKYFQDKKFQNIAILHAENEFAVSYRDVLKEGATSQGILVSSVEGFTNEANDFRTQLLKIKTQKPDAIFYVGTVAQIINVFKQANELGLKTQFVSIGSVEDQKLLDAGSLVEGLVYANPFDHTKDYAKEFVQKYQERYKQIPTYYASEAYVALELIAAASKECRYKIDIVCWKKFLDNLNNFPTIMGTGSINSRGDLKVGEVFLKTVKNGQFVKYEQ